jgi:hypothetical protein
MAARRTTPTLRDVQRALERAIAAADASVLRRFGIECALHAVGWYEDEVDGDVSIRAALEAALRRDGDLAHRDVRAAIRAAAALDGEGPEDMTTPGSLAWAAATLVLAGGGDARAAADLCADGASLLDARLEVRRWQLACIQSLLAEGGQDPSSARKRSPTRRT